VNPEGAEALVEARVKQPLPASVEPLDLVRAVVASVIDRGAEEIVILDLIGRTSYCDYLVLCNGTNARQVSAIASRTVRAVRDLGVRPLGVEGLDTGRWALIDLSDVIVHVFDGAMRGYYDIDGLWVDAPRLSVESLGLTPAPAREPEEDEAEADDDWMVDG
jgi:ribosome-associated protein